MLDVILLTVVLASAEAVSPGLDESTTDVADWIVTVESGDSSEEAILDAMRQLRGAARGPSQSPRTREAIFGLVKLLSAGGAEGTEERLRVLEAAQALYPNDPRSIDLLQELAFAQLEAGDTHGAHYTLVRLIARDTPLDDALLARGAVNAIRLDDMASAFQWSGRVDPGRLPVEQQTILHVSRLVSSEALGRHDEALSALKYLDLESPADLTKNPQALLAAARAEAAVGRLESAASRYELLLNVHSRESARPAAMLEYGRILVRLGKKPIADATYDWIMVDYPKAPESDLARVERVEIGDHASPKARADAYRRAAEESRSLTPALEATRRMFAHLLAEGLPLEAISTLGWMARTGEGFGGLAARSLIDQGLEPAMELIASREDPVGLVAAAAVARSAGFDLPEGSIGSLTAARRVLGLQPRVQALEQGRALAREGRWSELPDILQGALSGAAHELPERSAMTALLAEALWREGQRQEALTYLETGLDESAPFDRALFVLRADIRFETGELGLACADYRVARRLAASPWVDHQILSCDATKSDSAEGLQ